MTTPPARGLGRINAIAAANRSLAVAVTTHPDHPDPHVALVNAATIAHPSTGEPMVAFVTRRGAKLDNLRFRPRTTLVFHHEWDWVAVRGDVELAGPDDPHPTISEGDYAPLMRTIYSAAGGHHPDLDQYDEVMAAERRCAVLVHPQRIWTNPPGSEHKEPNRT